jgi:hypothetical protein
VQLTTRTGHDLVRDPRQRFLSLFNRCRHADLPELESTNHPSGEYSERSS